MLAPGELRSAAVEEKRGYLYPLQPEATEATDCQRRITNFNEVKRGHLQVILAHVDKAQNPQP